MEEIVLPSFKNIFNPSSIIHQRFSIPVNIIYYISMNPNSSKVYQKLIQTCKYFFNKNPIIVVERLETSEEHFCNMYGENYLSNGKNPLTIDILNAPTMKIWLTSLLDMNRETFKIACNSIISKIYRCDIDHLTIINQTITFEELKILKASKTIDTLIFYESTIKFDEKNGDLVPLEKILADLPNLRVIHFGGNNQLSITTKTAEALLQRLNMQNIGFFEIDNLSEIFDVETFFTNLKKPSKTCFNFSFDNSISEGFKEKLQKFVDSIIENGVTLEMREPKIEFPGQTQESIDAFNKLFEQWCESVTVLNTGIMVWTTDLYKELGIL